MKGLAFRKLSRTTSHRRALLRNLVTSLFQHDRIVTTVAKAKEAAREAEKLITLGKRTLAAGTIPRAIALKAGLDASTWTPDATPGAARAAAAASISPANHTGTGRVAHINARKYLYSPGQTLPELFTLAERYAARPGGYTRIHLMGHRKGDHAPRAVLELVDGPRDVRLEMTARAVGRQLYVGAAAAQAASLSRSGDGAPANLAAREPTLDAEGVEKVIRRFLTLTPAGKAVIAGLPEYGRDKDSAREIFGHLLKTSLLNAGTKDNIVKVTQYGGRDAIERLLSLATEHLRNMSAEDELHRRQAASSSAASKPASSSDSTSADISNVAPRGGPSTVTPPSSSLYVPKHSAYPSRSAAAGATEAASPPLPKTRRRLAGEWRPHFVPNPPSSLPTTAEPILPSARHRRTTLRVRRGGSESPLALGKGVFARKRLGRNLELVGGPRQASEWERVEKDAS